jgi:ankyrin repeat protein
MTPTQKLGPKSRPQDCTADAWELFCAAANGDLKTVQKIVRAKPELMHQFVWYQSPLHYAVRENQIDVVRELLEAGINPAFSNFTYSSWQTLLPIAKSRGFEELHTLLVAEMKRRFNYDSGYEQLWKTIVANDANEVRRLIEANPKRVNTGDEHGNRAIHWAVLSRRIPIIKLLLELGADVNARRADMRSPLLVALEGDYWFRGKHKPDTETSHRDVIQFLQDNGGEYEFTVAVARNDLEFVKSELAQKPQLAGLLNDARRSPLYYASIRGQTDMVRLLLQHGADPNLPEHCAAKGKALFEASARNDIEMMRLLIEHGAHADAYVDSSGNCLSIAQQGGEREKEAMDLLKKHGAMPGEWEVDTEDKVAAALDDERFLPNRDMWSSVLNQILALDKVLLLDKYVSRFGTGDIQNLNPSNGWRVPKSKEMLLKLLEYGTDINARDWNGRTFLHHSAHHETPAVAEFLVEAGIDIDVVDHQSGTTALGLAAWNGRLPVVEFLLSAGADPSLPADPKWAWALPLSFAKKQGHEDVVKRLATPSL